MTSKNSRPPAATEPVETAAPPLPSSGGSYVLGPDGRLIPETPPAGPADDAKEA